MRQMPRPRRSTFLRGMASVLDIGGTLPPSKLPESSLPRHESDYAALQADWEALNRDLWHAFDTYRQSHPLP